MISILIIFIFLLVSQSALCAECKLEDDENKKECVIKRVKEKNIPYWLDSLKFKASSAFTNTTGTEDPDNEIPGKINSEVINWQVGFGWYGKTLFPGFGENIERLKLNANIAYGKARSFDETDRSIDRKDEFTYVLGVSMDVPMDKILCGTFLTDC